MVFSDSSLILPVTPGTLRITSQLASTACFIEPFKKSIFQLLQGIALPFWIDIQDMLP